MDTYIRTERKKQRERERLKMLIYRTLPDVRAMFLRDFFLNNECNAANTRILTLYT